MQVSKISYAKLVNTGNFENKRYEIEILCDELDDPDAVFKYAKMQIEDFISADFTD